MENLIPCWSLQKSKVGYMFLCSNGQFIRYNNCSTKQTTGTKSLLSKDIYCAENPYLHVCKQNSGGLWGAQCSSIGTDYDYPNHWIQQPATNPGLFPLFCNKFWFFTGLF